MRLDTTIIQEQSFTDTCLPVTMGIAKVNISSILKHLTGYPKQWTYADKVLAWLSTVLTEYITSYYNSDGLPMDILFQEHQINKLDVSFSRILSTRLESIT